MFLSTRQSTNCVQYVRAYSELVHDKMVIIANESYTLELLMYPRDNPVINPVRM